MTRGKKPPTKLALALAQKLRAIQAELGKTDDGMADLLSIGRSRWTNWVNAENKPSEEAMMMLCDKAAVTMDWLYRDKPDGLALAHIIRLKARLLGLDPDIATVDVLTRPSGPT